MTTDAAALPTGTVHGHEAAGLVCEPDSTSEAGSTVLGAATP